MNFDDEELWSKLYHGMIHGLTPPGPGAREIIKMLSVLENMGEQTLLNQEQVEALRVKAIKCIELQMKGSSGAEELSIQELIILLRLSLKYLSQHDDVFERFDEVLSDRIANSGINTT
jgi:hypothetical protein